LAAAFERASTVAGALPASSRLTASIECFEMAIAGARMVGRGGRRLADAPVVTEDVPLKALVHPDDVSLEVKVGISSSGSTEPLAFGGNIIDALTGYHDSVRVVTFGNSEGP
jgi:predicted Zn-dependent protease